MCLLETVVHRSLDDLTLKLMRQIDEISAIAADPDEQVLVFSGILLSIQQLFAAMNIELDMPAAPLHEGLDEPAKLLQLFLAIQNGLGELHIHGIAAEFFGIWPVGR